VGTSPRRVLFVISCPTLQPQKEGALAYWLFVNTEKYPLNNKKLRKAIAYALNRREIVDNLKYY